MGRATATSSRTTPATRQSRRARRREPSAAGGKSGRSARWIRRPTGTSGVTHPGPVPPAVRGHARGPAPRPTPYDFARRRRRGPCRDRRVMAAAGMTRLIVAPASAGLIDMFSAWAPRIKACSNSSGFQVTWMSSTLPSRCSRGWPPWCAPSSTNPTPPRWSTSTAASWTPSPADSLTRQHISTTPATTCSPSPCSRTRSRARSGPTTRKSA